MKPYCTDLRVTNSLPDLHGRRHDRPPETATSHLHHHLQSSHFDPSFSHDDFLGQMLSTVPASSPWELDPSALQIPTTAASIGVQNGRSELLPPESDSENLEYQFDESPNPSSKLRGYQISETTQAAMMMMLQQQLLMSGGIIGAGAGDSGLLPMPLSLDGGNIEFEPGSCNGVVEGSSDFNCPNPVDDGLVSSLYNGSAGSLQQSQHFHRSQGNLTHTQNYGVPAAINNPPPPQSSVPAKVGGGGAAAAQPRQRVRARRGQATDPHSIAERLRRERIAERTRALQELVPNANKTDKASMLDEIIDYVKFLQLQVKVLSMSRLGGAAAAVPHLIGADISSENDGGCEAAGRRSGSARMPSSNDTMAVTEHRVAKLMEDDMGSAMQYLQGKGLCLMPISLATAISAAGNSIKNRHSLPITASNGGSGPASPSISVLTVQSAALGGGAVGSVSKP